MASLGELLADEGFKKGKLMQGGPRSSAASRAVSMPLYPMRQQNPLYREESRDLLDWAKSDAFSRRSLSVLPDSGGVRSASNRNSLAHRRRSLMDGRREKDMVDVEGLELRWPRDYLEVRGSSNRRANVPRPNSNDESRDDTEDSTDRYSSKSQEKSESRQRHGKKYSNNDENSARKNTTSFRVKPSGDEDGLKRGDQSSLSSEPALDEAAIQAVISILTGSIKRFYKDENFRASIRQSCASCLKLGDVEESIQEDSEVVANLKEAIATLERVVKTNQDPRELKKASVKLSVITGLTSSNLKDGYTCGILNMDLAACAHLYLSVIYKLQKKDRVSAKHLLQVFCDSPNKARTVLFPALWNHLFFPHLAHLKEWYDTEAECIPETSSRPMKMKVLEKVYNKILDMGTYEFAVYYKDWIVGDSEAPALPSIHAPQESMPVFPQEEIHVVGSVGVSSSDSSVSSQPMVSKSLYESMFNRSRKTDAAGKTRSNHEEEEEGEEAEEEIREEEGEEEEEEIREEEEVEEEQFMAPVKRAEEFQQSYEENETYSPRSKIYRGRHNHGVHNLSSSNPNDSNADEWTTNEHYHPRRIKYPEEEKEHNDGDENVEPSVLKYTSEPYVQRAKEYELTLEGLPQSVFHLQMVDHLEDVDNLTLTHPARMSICDLQQNNLSYEGYAKSEMKAPGKRSIFPDQILCKSISSAGSFGNHENIDHGSFFSSIPKDFLCPLTGQLFKDPVTLETGLTFERAAIKAWFDQGNRKCPVTGRALERLSVPTTNFVLKRVISGWQSEHCRNLLVSATQIIGHAMEQGCKSMDESALFVIEQLLCGFTAEEQVDNAKHLITLGVLHCLILRLELGNLEEKTRIVSLLLCFIKANGSSRGYLAVNIKGQCILELLHSKQVAARRNAVLLLIELICLNRPTMIRSFLCGLHTEATANTMHVLLLYLHSSQPEEKALVAVLILYFELMVEPRRYSIYREKAVDGITMALECSLSDETALSYSHRALLMLGGHFSSSGQPLIEIWLLKKAGFCGEYGIVPLDHDEVYEDLLEETAVMAREEWFKIMTLVVLDNGKRSFIETLSKCIGSGSPDLVRACLTTAAWLSHALASSSIAGFQLSAFSALVPQLRKKLEKGGQIEHRILASISLHNFSMIPECRALLLSLAEEMSEPLRSLLDVTWTAKQFYTTIVGDSLPSKGKKGISYSTS